MSYLSWIPIGISLVSVVIAALTYSRNGKKVIKRPSREYDRGMYFTVNDSSAYGSHVI